MITITLPVLNQQPDKMRCDIVQVDASTPSSDTRRYGYGLANFMLGHTSELFCDAVFICDLWNSAPLHDIDISMVDDAEELRGKLMATAIARLSCINPREFKLLLGHLGKVRP